MNRSPQQTVKTMFETKRQKQNAEDTNEHLNTENTNEHLNAKNIDSDETVSKNTQKMAILTRLSAKTYKQCRF